MILLAYASLLVLSLLDNIRSPYFPEILHELELTGTTGALFFSVTSLAAFVGSWSAHGIVGRFSSLLLLRAASVVLALGMVAISRSYALAPLLVSCTVFGYAYGALNLAQNLIIVEGSSPHLRRRIFSGLHSMYAFAALLAPVVASVFHWLSWSWRDAFLMTAVVSALLPFCSYRLQSRSISERVDFAGENPSPRLNRREWVQCLLFAAMLAGYLWGEVGASTRLVLWLRAEKGMSTDMANLYLGGFFVMLLSGRILFGLLHFERVSNWDVLKWSAGFSGLAFVLALTVSPIWMVLAGFFMSPFYPVAMEQISQIFGRKSPQALGFIIGSGSLSVVALHLCLGVLTDLRSVNFALSICPAALTTIAFGLWLRQRRALSRAL